MEMFYIWMQQCKNIFAYLNYILLHTLYYLFNIYIACLHIIIYLYKKYENLKFYSKHLIENYLKKINVFDKIYGGKIIP